MTKKYTVEADFENDVVEKLKTIKNTLLGKMFVQKKNETYPVRVRIINSNQSVDAVLNSA